MFDRTCVSVSITLIADGIVNEPSETFLLKLEPKPFTLQTIPRGEAVFFRNVLNLTILDGKPECKPLTAYIVC